MTLIEVTVSMLVLGVVLTGLGQGLAYSIRLNKDGKTRVASLNACKHITENVKTEISQSQSVFDETAPRSLTYYVDEDGNKTYSGTDANKVEAYTSASAFEVNEVIADNTALTQTVGGVSRVLVKVLVVRVVDVSNRNKAGRDITMKVEIMRPGA